MSLIGMGTTCVLPLQLEDAFRLAAECGYDGVEVMVTHDRATQSSEALDALAMRFGVPVLSVHAPIFARSSLVFGIDPLDFSHAGMSGRPATELTAQWGARLGHVHLCDATATPLSDEHLPPGEGVQPVAEVLSGLATGGFDGLIIAEISTRRCGNDSRMRAAMLTDTVQFARAHLAVETTR